MWAYFASPASALTNGTSNIPSSALTGNVLTVPPAQSGVGNCLFNSAGAFSMSSCQIFHGMPGGSVNGNATLTFTLNTTGLTLVTGTYAGTVFFQAQAV
jgi:hypothetical protein